MGKDATGKNEKDLKKRDFLCGKGIFTKSKSPRTIAQEDFFDFQKPLQFSLTSS